MSNAYFHNPANGIPGGWQPMSTALLDGTVVELMCTYGVAPWYGLFQWVEGRWCGVPDSSSSVSDDGHLQWRPYDGDVAAYVDPTGGAQDDPAYWRRAAAARHGLPPDYFEKGTEEPNTKGSLLQRLFG